MYRCEWGHDDYSLNVANLQPLKYAEPEPDAPPANHAATPKKVERRGRAQMSLFEGADQ